MSIPSKTVLPPNPYTRQPIRKREYLAGRGRELRSIRYYLGLTASGQSPHLALIGQRGVGKTSLLNGADFIAAELKLLPVRFDLNEQKVRTSGEFWHDLYATLILALAKAGCWGGLQSAIYSDMFRMLHAKQQPTSLDHVVLQTPFAYACHQGPPATFSCVDALVVHDFVACIEELEHRGYVGIVLLIDEADCLGTNVALLQMLRNIFQIVQRFSLILAGTEAIFPSISDVFSPVPRQFHRIDVKPFASFNGTQQLIIRPLKKNNQKDIAPKLRQIRELHELCGGDPSEAQLYCHHMYRMVEEGKADRMELTPQVFREILREYRASAPANLETALNAIERLPDKYLYESVWLSRRNISLEENIRVEVLKRSLKNQADTSTEERGVIAWDVKEGYEALFNAGVIDSQDHIRLIGSPLTAGFWKSFVEVEKGKRWTWDDDSFGLLLQRKVVGALAKSLGIETYYELDHGEEAVAALNALRDGGPINEYRDSFTEMVLAGILAQEKGKKVTSAVDISFQMESPAGRQTCRYRLLENSDTPVTRELVEEWIQSKLEILSSNDIALSLLGYSYWQLPTPLEFHRLARLTGVELPERIFGPSELDVAITKFDEGKIKECADILDGLFRDKADPIIANNSGFCKLLLGLNKEGLESIEKALAIQYDPLFELNKAIGVYLLGDLEAASGLLLHALTWIEQNKDNKYNETNPLYVLMLDPVSTTLKSVPEVPLVAAILINLWCIKKISKADLQMKMETAYPESFRSLLLLAEPNQ